MFYVSFDFFVYFMRIPFLSARTSADDDQGTSPNQFSKGDDTVGAMTYPSGPGFFRGVSVASTTRHEAHNVSLGSFSNTITTSGLHELPPQEAIDQYRNKCEQDVRDELAQRASVENLIFRFSPSDRDRAVEFRAQSHAYFDWLFFYNKLALQVFDRPLFVGEVPAGVSDIVLTREQFRDLIPYIKSDSILFPSMVQFLKFVDDSFEEDRVQRLK